MLKYDIGSLKFAKSHKIILEQIEEGSTVLECGCATGYMTSFMKEKLGCKVYIIEYDRDGFNIAMNFAEDGICCDLMTEDWIVKFWKMKFDYILFADVLEHLYDPSYPLRNAVPMLKEDGKIIVSLPNIAHNDIIANLVNDRFDYTDIGLLDNTHIKFFGRKNLDVFFNKAGLSVVKLRYNLHAMNRSEQKLDYGEEDSALLEVLENRPYGTVYQFIITSQKTSYCEKNNIVLDEEKIENLPYQYTVYYSNNGIFNNKDKIIGCFGIDGLVNIEIDNEKLKAKYFRFDPVEGYGCFIENMVVEADDRKVNILNTNGFNNDNILFFKTKDPQVKFCEMDENISKIKISAKVVPVIAKSQYKMLDNIYNISNEKNKLLSGLIEENKIINNKFMEMEKKFINQKNMVEILENKLNNDILQKDKLLKEKQIKIEKSEKLINDMENTISWKITRPIRKIRGIMRRKD